jgi:hypothetical protein
MLGTRITILCFILLHVLFKHGSKQIMELVIGKCCNNDGMSNAYKRTKRINYHGQSQLSQKNGLTDP